MFCFSLPSYDSYDDLRRMVLIAINEGSEGFGKSMWRRFPLIQTLTIL